MTDTVGAGRGRAVAGNVRARVLSFSVTGTRAVNKPSDTQSPCVSTYGPCAP